MIRFPSRFSVAHLLLACTFALAESESLRAVNPNNAGPAQFEIKFRLPPPKPLTPEEELATFKLAPGFRAELVAAEPLVESPVAISWDERGRMFVCEMTNFMHDVEGAGEDQPIGRIAVLEDTNGDGKMDKRTVFADGLIMPRAVMCVNGGALVGEPPMMWFMKDTDGDGKADVKEPVENNFGNRQGQPEHMANSPTWMLDNWIYFANHPARYRLKDGKFIVETAPSRGQWGLSQDDFGRPFFNFNSDFLRANLVPEALALRNRNYVPTQGLGVQVLKPQTCWPSHPTPGVNRGYEAATLRKDGSLKASTAACGPAVYRGALFPEEFTGNVFIPEPAGNLVKRVVLSEKDANITGKNAYEGSEFWTSTDERFRPATAYTGPDGALYVADMYRGVIQHKGYITHYLIANIKDRKLEQPLNYGRIWRIVPEGKALQHVKLPEENAKLVEYLGHPNGWVRDTAQRVLVERRDTITKDPNVIPLIARFAHQSPTSQGKLHALWTLEGIGVHPPEGIDSGLLSPEPKVRAGTVRIAPPAYMAQLAKMVDDPSIDVQIALGYQLGAAPEARDAVLTLARRSGHLALVREALLSGLQGQELEVLQALVTNADKAIHGDMLSALVTAVMNERNPERVKRLVTLIGTQLANSPAQVAMLRGAASKAAGGAKKPKLIFLNEELRELATLAAAADDTTKPLVAALDARIGWPGKAGMPVDEIVKPLTAEEQQLFKAGKTVYTMICGGCHQANGAGMEGLAPPLVDSEWVTGKPEVLVKIVAHGLTGKITVKGRPWALEMPPMGAALPDQQLAGVLTYIRREWEHTASPVTADMVAKVRAENKERTKAWTAAELGLGTAETEESAN